MIMVLNQEGNGRMCLVFCAFSWNEATKKTFVVLKHVMCTPLVLAMLAFTNTFVLEFDASRKNLGAILM